MQNPIREQIRLDGQWQTRRTGENAVSVFVPGSWTEKQVVLRAGAEGDWRPEPDLQHGAWNTLEFPPGALPGARLVASEALHMTRLQAAPVGDRALGIRISLEGPAPTPAPLTLNFTLTAADGRRIGAVDLVVNNNSRDLSAEMDLQAPFAGPHRLKATLSCGDQVVDNARIDINL